MRKILAVLLTGALILTSQVNLASAQDVPAEAMKYQWPPMMDLEKNASGTTGYYWLTTDTFAGRSTEGEGHSFISLLPEVQPSCEDFADPICLRIIADTGATWWSNLVLNSCTLNLDKYPCVDGVTLEVDGESRSLLFEQHVAGPTWPADESIKLPPGGRASLWRDPNGDQSIRYLVIVAGRLPSPEELANPGGERRILENFQASITATRVVTGEYSGFRRFLDGDGVPRMNFGTQPYCEWVIEGSCGYKINFVPGSRLQLSINLPSVARGYLIGRMKSPVVQFTRISSDRINLKVSAEPIMVPYLRAVTPWAQSTSEMRGHFNNPRKYFCSSSDSSCKKGLVGAGTASSGEAAFDYYQLFQKSLPERAALMVPVWSFRNHIANLGRCWSNDVFQGLVSTNAAIYEGDPPKLIDGELVYKVAGVHREPDGKVFRGSYDLNIPSTIARCLYKLSDGPIRASISIVNENGDVAVETTSFVERDGWIRLSANGFTFSQPTIKVALSQDASVVAPTPQSTPQPTKSVTPSTGASAAKQSITCTKGERVKKVPATRGKCPKGFKKK